MSGLPIDLALAWDSLPDMWRGLVTTFWVCLLPLIFGLALAFPVCFARMSPNPFVNGPAKIFVVFFRGAPVLILLYLIYNGLAQIPAIRNGPLWFVFGSGFACAVIGLTLNHAAYMVEILRGSLLAVPPGLVEASRALGISRRDIFIWVRMPVAIRYGVKAYQNEIIGFIKGTSIVSVVTVTDLTAVANEIFENTYDPFTPILTAAFLYWCLINVIRIIFGAWERRLERHHVVEPTKRLAGAGPAPVASSIGGAPVAVHEPAL
jgi:His/Glu/Gln/Arg/opine family amino acid ABC transporter permease subunit